jgi:DNA-binding winged helix-turn-helix (wHTH) protein
MLPLDAQSVEKTTFGPFELNCRTSELFKNGKRVRLSGQSAHLLVILVQRANQLVSREDLRLTLWSEDTYVDFDRGLNNCVSRVREALCDSAAVPRYIETLPKQGYRFIAKIRDSRPTPTVFMDVVPERRLDPVALSTSTPPFSAAWRGGRTWGVLAIVSSVLLTGIGMVWQLWQRDYFWHNPLDGAKVQRLTDFEGDELDAAISEDGKFAIFSSDRSGQPEVWLTEIGSSDFENVTKGSVPRLVFNNGTVRRAGFSGDGSQVWATEQASSHPIKEKTWIGPALGGAFHPFLEEGLEPAWSPDGRRIVYHTPDAGDPIFIADQNGGDARQIFRQQAGVHCHFLTWSPDGRFIYFASGTPTTEEMDIWRIPASARAPVAERITHNKTRVAYLGWLDTRTLIYSATAEDGPGQWLYSMDVEHRIPHRVSFGIEDEYLSASVSETHPRRLVASVARPGASLWTIPLSNRMEPEASAVRLPVPNTSALGPRFGDGYLLFLAGRGVGDGLWRLDGGSARELWKGNEGGLVAPPAMLRVAGRYVFRSGRRAALASTL